MAMQWLAATVLDNHHWTDRLFSLRLQVDVDPFVAGQLGRLALEIDGKRVGRPYSYVNAPHESEVEFCVITVPDGPLSPRLNTLEAGDRIFVASRAAGMFTVEQVPDSKYLCMFATGTAIGAFMSMLKTDTPWQRFERILLVHAVRNAEDLVYRDQLLSIQQQHVDQLVIVPFVSREETDFAIKGRITDVIKNGHLENKAGFEFNSSSTHVMICGNPDMVKDTTEILERRGFTKNTHREDGTYSIENYW